MSDIHDSAVMICRQICDSADELRDLWLKSQTRTRIREIMALTVNQSRLLRMVGRMTQKAPDGVNLRSLAVELCLSSSAVSVMVETLVQRGWLERNTAANDRRKVLIRISHAGKSQQGVQDKFFSEKIREFCQMCESDKLSCFEDVLQKFTEFLVKKKEFKK